MPLLLLGHASLSLVALGTRFLPRGARLWALRLIGAGGMVLGLALVLERHSAAVWRTAQISPDVAAAAGLAAAAAWLVSIVGASDDGAPSAAALVGVAAAGLTLFGANAWVVPGLVFWMCSSLALVGLSLSTPGRAPAALAVTLSDLLLVVALVAPALERGEWRMPVSVDGWAWWLLLSAAAIRAGVVPLVGVWASLGSPAAAMLPLLAGSAFVVAGGTGSATQPWAAAALLAVSLAAAGWTLAARRVRVSVVGAWATGMTLALCWVEPAVVALAAAAGMMMVVTCTIWALAPGHARLERALLIAALPPTAAFAAVAVAALRAFERATSSQSPAQAASWSAVLALLPITLSAGVALAARVGKERPSATARLAAILATWLVFGASIVMGVAPAVLLPAGAIPFGDSAEAVSLHVMAVLLGGVAGWLVFARTGIAARVEPVGESTGAAVPAADEAFVHVAAPLAGRIAVVAAWLTVLLATVVVAGVGWFTVRGLRAGFL